MDRCLPRQFPFHLAWDELPEPTTTSVTASEFLVTGRRGAVLPRVPGAVYAHCDTAQQTLVARSTGHWPRCGDRDLFHAVRSTDEFQPYGCLLFPIHQSLGAGAWS